MDINLIKKEINDWIRLKRDAYVNDDQLLIGKFGRGYIKALDDFKSMFNRLVDQSQNDGN